MTHNGSYIIAPTVQAASPAVTFPFLCSEAALPSPSTFHVVGVVVVVVVVMFESLHLAEICTLMSTFCHYITAVMVL